MTAGLTMPGDVLAVSNSLLFRSFSSGTPVTPMQLQRLLYFTASQYLKRAGLPLSGTMFQPWPYGPVVPSVHSQFRTFRGSHIRRYGKDAMSRSYRSNETEDQDLKKALDEVWAATAGMPAHALSTITHRRGSAWYKAWQNETRFLNDRDIQDDDTYLGPLGLDDPRS